MDPFFAGPRRAGMGPARARTPPDRRREVEGPTLSKRPIDLLPHLFYATPPCSARRPRCAARWISSASSGCLVRVGSPFDPEKGPGYIRATIENIESLGLCPTPIRERLYAGNARSGARG
jgi:aminocarboxymuconate-semialdehyde decarboxylase